MISSSTFETWCICIGIGGTTCLSIWTCVGYTSSGVLISLVGRPISVEPSPVNVHWDWDVVHAPGGICEVVIASPSKVESVWISLVVIITTIVVRIVVWLESSTQLIVKALEVSKHSSLKPRLRNEGGSIGLSHLVALGALAEDVLQQLLNSGSLDCMFFGGRIVHSLRGFQYVFQQ